jgi:ABC-2 type transport system ATP-binding protein
MSAVISLEKVCKKIGTREILKDVDFTVKKGDIFGYLGPNGAGKTTTIRILLGLMRADEGRVSVLEEDSQNEKVRCKIGFVLESDGLYDNLNAYANLAYYAGLYEVTKPEEKIKAAIKSVGLADRMGDKVGTFSKGMRQKLALARAMVHDPEVLILDEPTAGVDPSGQIEIRELMKNMVNNQGKTIFLSSHNLDEVHRICNRIALIHRGEIRVSGNLEKIQKEMSRGGVNIETAEPVTSAIMEELRRMPELSLLEQHDNWLAVASGANTDISAIVNLLAARGVRIEQVRRQEASLEEIYTTFLKEAGGEKTQHE